MGHEVLVMVALLFGAVGFVLNAVWALYLLGFGRFCQNHQIAEGWDALGGETPINTGASGFRGNAGIAD